jgi:ribonucleotide reductase alpha subunit
MQQQQTIELRVLKRDNTLQDVSFDKILIRVKQLCEQEPQIKTIPLTNLVMKIIDQLHDKIQTKQIDELTAEQCALMSTHHPDYAVLAGRISISNHHKNTLNSFSETLQEIKRQNDTLINDELFEFILTNKEEIENEIDYSKDYLFDYFGFKTLEKAYLLKVQEPFCQERPQHMWMRVALSIHPKNLEKAFETYQLMSQKYFTHATPTLFNAGSKKCQLSSCFLLAMESDSIDGIYNTLKDAANISKWSGGIGLHISNIRAKSALIQGTNGLANGIVPMLKLFNDTAKFVNQGGKRNGSFAIYLEPWHADIEDFLELKKNHGDDEKRARDLFYGLWIPDLFMSRVSENGLWSLFCPQRCPRLADVYGEEFEILYCNYENNKQYVKQVPAREIWFRILDAQMETGNPYLLYKDAVNYKSNQKNLGTIKSSNLCCEVLLYTDQNETAVCNLASIALPSFVKNNKFDFKKLHEISKVVTTNLNNIIDINYYPTEKSKRSNLLHRPIGIGVQGLADVFMMLNIPFTCEKAKRLNKSIFETIYHAALERSNEICFERNNYFLKHSTLLETFRCSNQKDCQLPTNNNFHVIHAELDNFDKTSLLNGAYSSFQGSPASQGILQYDLWDKTLDVEECGNNDDFFPQYDWLTLKTKIQTYGLRNSTLISPMPTASTSQILGFTECFEPITSNMYSRHTLAGEFMITNKYFVNEMIQRGLWSEEMRLNIIKNRGSVQQFSNIVEQNVLDKYKTVWELPMKSIIDMAADRSAFICQSQSLNLWLQEPTHKSLTSMHFYAWKKGLKTGIYYLRRKGKHHAQQFTIEPQQVRQVQETTESSIPCEMCMA